LRTPWAFAERKAQIGNRNEAARLLRDTALDCIAARASSYERVLLTLSGGLDPLLVAACLSRQPTKFHALNLVTDDPNGDERLHARRVSEILGNGLTETFREVTRFDIRQSGARNLPRPCVRGFAVESLRLAHETARAVGADAIFNGGGGDNVFVRCNQDRPPLIACWSKGLGTGFLRTAKDMSLFAQASLPAVLGDALQRAWLGKPRLPPEARTRSAFA
jgi:asparagine synthase (glutamine-hydrolysing)